MLGFKGLMLALKFQKLVISISIKQLLAFKTPKCGAYTAKIGVLNTKMSEIDLKYHFKCQKGC